MTQKFLSTCVTILLACLLTESVKAQNPGDANYLPLYNSGNYSKALEIIIKNLDDFYITRVDDKRIPTGFITIKEAAKEIDLKTIFRTRKAEHFFIEDNIVISSLHLYAARCYFKLSNYDNALNHYVQALRYKKVEENKDDVIYYEIAQVFRKTNYFTAYINHLETASLLNKNNVSYSLELGTVLYRTAMKKQAIHHLERYIKGTEDTISPDLYLMLGNLYEDTGRYLETEKYYMKYLEKMPDDGYKQFALGHIAYYRTGNYPLALASLDKALVSLPKNEIYRISKSYEYKADIALSELDFKNALQFYSETIKYQTRISEDINNKKAELAALNLKIRNIKSALLREENFEQYTEYELLLDAKGKKESEIRQIENEYTKLNAGKVRWNMAYSYERLGDYTGAIKYYRDVISYDYNANQARKKIINLELKIKRGY
ncbi:MAG TPA: tetratricopeptide repeat protein [Spirochaetota bacterium]|nr:tetratricopeptide repeat protein [Spirochaetota bacterium]